MSELINKIWTRLFSRPEPESSTVKPAPVTGAIRKISKLRYLNQEVSDLQFIERILDEAGNLNHPLFERLRFLSISVSVLDQFFTVRVARLSRFVRDHKSHLSPDGLTPIEQLDLIKHRTNSLMEKQQSLWKTQRQELTTAGIHLLDQKQLTESDLSWLKSYFVSHVLPILTPFTLNEEHPFPFIPSEGICIVLQFDDKSTLVVPLPANLPRFVKLPGESTRYVPMEVAVYEHSSFLFEGQTLENAGLFQILRDNDLAREERSDDLRSMIESGLRLRHKANVIRLKVASLTEENIRFIANQMGLLSWEESDLLDQQGDTIMNKDYISRSVPGLSHVDQLINPNLYPELIFTPFQARYPQRLKDFDHDCFAAIAKKDLLVHWPYESFDTVIRFLEQAARDEDVLSIKQTLYRTNDDSPIVNAMVSASAAGKIVTAIIELEARDNEQSNVALAKRLESAGVQIVYGIVGLKIHGKLTVITRREGDETVLYSHFGTGNYHPDNARIYTDLSFFTRNQDLGKDANKVFNYITTEKFFPTEHLIVAPKQLRSGLRDLIQTEIDNAKNGHPAAIWAKLNSLTDPKLIDKLYEASEAGVAIDLIIRRHCCLIPGVKGMSSNIRVKSIVGRFLEHARIYCFANGHKMGHQHASVYLASADWMERNMDDRVEVMVPLWDDTVRTQILEQIMLANLKDTRQSWQLQSNGEYQRAEGEDDFCAQSYFLLSPNLSGLGSLKGETRIDRVKHA